MHRHPKTRTVYFLNANDRLYYWDDERPFAVVPRVVPIFLMSDEIRIIGGGTVGRRITDRLEHRGDSVVIVESDDDRAAELDTAGYRVVHGDGTDLAVMEDAEFASADIVVAATADDDQNLLATQLVRSKFDTETVIGRVNQPRNEAPFEDLGVTTVSHSDAIAGVIDMHVESPSLTEWMESIGQGGDVQEVAVRNEAYAGLTIDEVDAALPDQVLLAMVGGEADAHLPERDEVLEIGDHVTLIGDRAAVRNAMDRLSGEASQVEAIEE